MPWYMYALLYATMAVNLGTGYFNLVQHVKWQRRFTGLVDRAKMIGYLSGYEAGKRAHHASN